MNQWGELCYLVRIECHRGRRASTNIANQALDRQTNVLRGVVVCKLEPHRSGTFRGYIAMLAVVEEYRGHGIATKLVKMAIAAMTERGADEVTLETECSNTASLRLYERLGFLRSKKLHRYYLNGNSAFRLQLYLKEGTGRKRVMLEEQLELRPHADYADNVEDLVRPAPS